MVLKFLRGYLNILKIVRSLHINEVHFVSQRGPFRKLVEISILCEQIESYLAHENSFKVMMSKFDKECVI